MPLFHSLPHKRGLDIWLDGHLVGLFVFCIIIILTHRGASLVEGNASKKEQLKAYTRLGP